MNIGQYRALVHSCEICLELLFFKKKNPLYYTSTCEVLFGLLPVVDNLRKKKLEYFIITSFEQQVFFKKNPIIP